MTRPGTKAVIGSAGRRTLTTNSTLITFALLVFAALVPGCSKGQEEPIASPSSVFPSASGATAGTTGITDATGGTAGLPTTSPGEATGHVTSGSVSLRLSGDLAFERTLDQLVSTVYQPPPGALVLVWTAGGTNATTLGIGGASFTGTRPTSASLTFNAVVQTSGEIATFSSTNGECQITIDEATETRIAGSYRCPDLSSGTGEVVHAEGSFQAEA